MSKQVRIVGTFSHYFFFEFGIRTQLWDRFGGNYWFYCWWYCRKFGIFCQLYTVHLVFSVKELAAYYWQNGSYYSMVN